MLDAIARYLPTWSLTDPCSEEGKTTGTGSLTPPCSTSEGSRSEAEEGPVGDEVDVGEVVREGHEQSTERMAYNEMVRSVVEREYPQLRNSTYLDHSACPPAPSLLLQNHIRTLTTELYSNPHSHSPSSARTLLEVERIRALVLGRIFGVGFGAVGTVAGSAGGGGMEEGWDLIWTGGATAGLKLIGESFEYDPSSPPPLTDMSSNSDGRGEYLHLREAHTSLVGVRDLAIRAGARSRSVGLEDLLSGGGGGNPARGRRLIGIPLQCNATGRRYLEHVARIRGSSEDGTNRETYVLLDAAAYLSGHRTRYDLSRIPYASAPDFIAFSFYKIFGYPTGLGGLVVKRSSAHTLSRKRYHGGGTLDAYTTEKVWKAPKGSRRGVPSEGLGARFEDGTIDFQGIMAIPHGLRALDELYGPADVRGRHVDWLTTRVLRRCVGMTHANGRPVVRVYSESAFVVGLRAGATVGDTAAGSDQLDGQGATMNFNILTSSGQVVPPTEVDRLACVQNIHLREGRHCNTGVITNQLGVTEDQIVERYRSGYGCDDVGLGDGAQVTSSLRISLGISNTVQDVDTFTSFLERFFLDRRVEPLDGVEQAADRGDAAGSFTLSQMVVYPIKSCAGQDIPADTPWPLTPHGLEHDREWVIVSLTNGKILSQKRYPRMALIRPRVDLERRILCIDFGGCSHEVDVSLPTVEASSGADEICGEAVKPTILHDSTLQAELSNFLGLPCALARQIGMRESKLGRADATMDRIPLLLSNESPFLLINDASVDAVSGWIATDDRRKGPMRPARASSFRANFVLSPADGSPRRAFPEDDFAAVQIGNQTFAALGKCRRCQMVAIDQETGEKTPATFLALAKHRRCDRGRIYFGQHLTWIKPEDGRMATIQAGMPVALLRYD